MEEALETARENFIQGMSRISDFWGFPKAMGAIYGAIYLSPDSLTLDELVEQVGVSKGAVSTHVRSLERLGMLQKEVRLGDRKDYYVAETDFWQVIKGILLEREKSEFDRALRTVDESMAMVESAELTAEGRELASFYEERMREMKRFFNRLDNLVAMLVALDELRMGSLQAMFNRSSKGREGTRSISE